MPISLWLKWQAWWILNGPPPALREDYLAADLALRTFIQHTPESERSVVHFLPPWRKPSDYRVWVDFGDDGGSGPTEYSVE